MIFHFALRRYQTFRLDHGQTASRFIWRSTAQICTITIAEMNGIAEIRWLLRRCELLLLTAIHYDICGVIVSFTPCTEIIGACLV